MSRVLDLRKKNKKSAGAKQLQKLAINGKPLSALAVEQSPPRLSWEAPSFYFNPQKKYLSLIVIALVAGGGAMFFFVQDTLMAIFMVLASLVLILYSNKRPEISRIRIDQSGIVVGNNEYRYNDLRSFWIHYYPGNIKELSLESKKWYLPYVKVSVEDQNPLIIRSLLMNFLPEKEHEHSLVDIIARRIGL